MSPLRVRVDRDVCRGAQACVRRAPGTFALDADGKSAPAQDPPDPEDVIREAAAACPFFAIEVTDDSA